MTKRRPLAVRFAATWLLAGAILGVVLGARVGIAVGFVIAAGYIGALSWQVAIRRPHWPSGHTSALRRLTNE